MDVGWASAHQPHHSTNRTQPKQANPPIPSFPPFSDGIGLSVQGGA
ncbi:hypothetical protein [Neisseria lactamica]|nr:hypothetical protein [Neisseria lactamica]